MSRLMIQAFFPVNLAKAESHWLGDLLLNELFFPPHVAQLCPEVVITFYGMAVRQPALAASATLGMVVGLKGGYDLWKLMEVSRVTASKSEATKRPRPSTILWALAFAAFGTMNMSALPLHCLFPAPETTYPKEVRRDDLTLILKYFADLSSLIIFELTINRIRFCGQSIHT
jgi:hypothetical protein